MTLNNTFYMPIKSYYMKDKLFILNDLVSKDLQEVTKSNRPMPCQIK